jgi:hypothetical protein
MPLFQMDSQKVFQNEYWTNRYILNATDLATAVTAAAFIRAAEKAVHYDIVTLDKYRVSDMLPGTDVYQVISDNVAGSRSTGGGDYLPLFNVVRCDFNTVGGGRPSRKYLRIPLGEGEQTAGVLAPAVITFFMTNFVTPLVSLGNFVDVDGQAFTTGSVHRLVGMRQLRRGSKRKQQPIIQG